MEQFEDKVRDEIEMQTKGKHPENTVSVTVKVGVGETDDPLW